MSNDNLPPPSTKPVWPIVVACLVLVVGIAVAAVFIGMNLNDSEDEASGRDQAPAYATSSGDSSDDDEPSDDESSSSDDSEGDEKSDEPKDEETSDKSDEPKGDDKTDTSESPEEDGKSDAPKEDPPESNQAPEDPRLACGGATNVLTTRTATFGASICESASGDYVYRGLSDNIKGSLVLQASFDGSSGRWVATNQTYEYSVDADTGHLTIRNRENNEVYGSEPAVSFRSQ